MDAVTDAVAEVFAAHPIPDTGDLRGDLRAYLLDIGRVLSEPRTRQIFGALVSEAATDTSLAAALRERVSEPRRHELETRLQAHGAMIAVPISTAIDQLVGPIYYRTVITESALDEELVDAVLDAVLQAERRRDRRHVQVKGHQVSRMTSCALMDPLFEFRASPTIGRGAEHGQNLMRLE